MTDNSGFNFGRPDQHGEAPDLAQPSSNSQFDAGQTTPSQPDDLARGQAQDPYGHPMYGQQPQQQAPYVGQPSAAPFAGQAQPGYAPAADASSQHYGFPGYAQDAYGQQQGYPVQPYGQPGQGYGAAMLPEHPQATTVLILAILGLFTSGICSWIAWYMGGQAKKEIEAGAPFRWDGNLKTGYILGKVFGIIAIIGVVLAIIVLIILMGVAVVNS